MLSTEDRVALFVLVFGASVAFGFYKARAGTAPAAATPPRLPPGPQGGEGMWSWLRRQAPPASPIPVARAPVEQVRPVTPVTPVTPIRDESSASPIGPTSPVTAVAQWAPYLAAGCARAGIPLAFALKWVEIESGGNPCAVGYPSAKGPDGGPKEMGIAQFFNAHDLKSLRLSTSELRAYCVPGDQHEVTVRDRDGRPKKIRGFSQQQSRPLTPAEMQQQADATVGLIERSMREATEDLRKIGAGAGWSPRRRSYWALVKLQHGLPDLSRSGLAIVTKPCACRLRTGRSSPTACAGTSSARRARTTAAGSRRSSGTPSAPRR